MLNTMNSSARVRRDDGQTIEFARQMPFKTSDLRSFATRSGGEDGTLPDTYQTSVASLQLG
jgi:hypothetical protein